MPRAENTVTIDAPPAFVADVHYDFASLPEWNPLIRSLVASEVTPRGRPAVGSILQSTLTMGDPDKPAAGIPVVVVRADDEEFSWLLTAGHWIVFQSHHRFVFRSCDDGRTTILEHSETFTGILGWVVFAICGRKVEKMYVEMDGKFKDEVEKRYAKVTAGSDNAGVVGSE